jgi:hypothetical protein
MGAMERNAVKGQRAAIGSLSRVASGGKRHCLAKNQRGDQAVGSVTNQHLDAAALRPPYHWLVRRGVIGLLVSVLLVAGSERHLSPGSPLRTLGLPDTF